MTYLVLWAPDNFRRYINVFNNMLYKTNFFPYHIDCLRFDNENKNYDELDKYC